VLWGQYRKEETSFVDALLVHELNLALPRVCRAFRHRHLLYALRLARSQDCLDDIRRSNTYVNICLPSQTFRYDMHILSIP